MSETLAERIATANEELLSHGNIGNVEEFFAGAYVVHLSDRDIRGTQFVTGFIDKLRSAFPDLAVDVEVLLAEGDRVAWIRTMRATHEGDFQGFPATGRAMLWRDMVVSRFEDGKIAEEWAISDLAERLLAARH